jgi:hypothetical protein
MANVAPHTRRRYNQMTAPLKTGAKLNVFKLEQTPGSFYVFLNQYTASVIEFT